MFQINDLVVYGKNGVCSVKGIGTLSLINNDRIYYTLVPVYNKEEIIYAPVENGRIVMREVISREDAKELIDIFPDLEETVVANERDRENCYKQTLLGCNCEKLASMIKTIYNRKCKRISEGKKVTVVDEKYFRQAEEQLFGELTFALDVDKTKISEMISERF